MTVARTKTITLLIVPILAVGEFVVDLNTPLGVTDWVWYVIPLLFSLYVGGQLLPYGLAAALSGLMLLGFFFSPPGIDPQWALISRLVGVLVLWVMALMIRQHKQTAAEVRRLSRAVEHSPVSIIITDKAGQIEYVNPKFTEVTGYSSSEAIGKNPRLLKSGEMPPEHYQRLWQTISGGGEWRGEFRNRKKNGEFYWESASISAMADSNGKITHFLAVKEDITERKRAEEALATEQRLLNNFITATPDQVYLKDRECRFVRINEAFARRIGLLHPSAAPGKTDFDIFGEQHARRAYEDEQRIMATGEPMIDQEEREDWKDGRITWVTSTKMPLRDSAGKIIGIMGVSRDITGRKQAELALAESRNYLGKIINAAADPIFVKDRQHRWVLVNDACCHFIGRQREELLGKSNYDFFPKAEADVSWLKDEVVFNTGKENINEEIYTTAGGDIRTIIAKKTLYTDEKGEQFIVGIISNITARKQAERQLAETLDFNQKIISDASAGIVVYKASGQCVLANETAAQAINATTPRLLDQNFRELESWRVSGMLKVAEEVLATGKPQHCEAHFVSSFGKETWLSCNFSFFVRGNEPNLLLLFNDVTGRRQAEGHVREQAALLDKAQDAIFVLDPDHRIIYWNKSAERIYGWTAAEAIGKSSVELLFQGVVTPQLAHAMKTVNERGEWVGELQECTKAGKTVTVQGRCNLIRDEQGRLKSRLIINTDITERKKFEMQFLRSQRMEGIGALAGGIAHDLNNILTPLLVAVQILKEKITDEDGQKLLRSLETNVQRGAGLVKQVLAFGRGVSGERIAINPKHITREIKQIIQETFPKSVEFELHSAADLWAITGDPTQLHQVLLNLCVNARDAMPQGGKLSIHMENIMFDETYVGMNPEATAGPYVCIKVTDSGTGIPREIQNRIFDPFFTTKELGKGTGLGLSTTLVIVKSHGGFIHCHSAAGQGSRFEVYFPANNTAAPAAKAAAAEASLLHGHNELVLLVDDEEPIRRIAQKTLEHYGYRVLLAADGAEAVSLYTPRRKEIDVVITDIVMPIMDGPAMIVALKTINPDVKIVSSSGLASEGGMAKARNAGVRYFIPKPYTAETMLHALHDVLNGN